MNSAFLILKLAALIYLGSNFYDNRITLLDGTEVSMYELSNKRLVIATFNQSDSCIAELMRLDSLQRTTDSIQVIATPAVDYGCFSSADSLKLFTDSLHLSFLITQPMMVKKGPNQDSLYQWLTNADYNNYFNDDVQAAGDLFIVSSDGVLYATAGKEIRMSTLQTVLQHKAPDY